MRNWDWGRIVGRAVGLVGVSLAAVLVGRRIGNAVAREFGPALHELSRLSHLRRAEAASRGIR